MRILRSAASIAAICALPLVSFAEAPALNLSTAARSFQPGELVVLTISTGGEASAVHVDVFGGRITAYKADGDDWRALVGIDLSQRPGRYSMMVEATVGAETLTASRPLVVKPKTFAVRTLRVEPDFVKPSPATLNRIEAETAFLTSVYARSAGQRLWDDPLLRPVPQQVNSRFGSRSVFNGERRSPHSGTDFLSPQGTPVQAPGAGRIVCARDLVFTGNTVIIDHGLGVLSLLAHLSRLDVREGDTAEAGQIVGLVGATGRVTGPHLHWALTVSGARVDPMSALTLLGAAESSERIK